MGIRRNLKGEYIWMEAYKNTKHKQMPVSFSSSNIYFDHGGKLEITDIENKIIKGNHGYIEWMFATFDPNGVSISENFIEFIIKYSMEGLKQRIDGDESFITNEVMKKHMNNFKNKRRDSNDFKNAVKVIVDFYNPKNIKTIDQ
jgi:hypothetical protein